MTTYPRFRADGSLHSFEFSNAFFWGLGALRRVVESGGGASFKRHWVGTTRYSFAFREEQYVIEEDFGDSDRYWLGPKNAESLIDCTPLHVRFQVFRFRLTFDREFRS